MATPFRETSGPSRIATGEKSPLDFLKQFFSMQMLEMIVIQTNLYREQCHTRRESSS